MHSMLSNATHILDGLQKKKIHIPDSGKSHSLLTLLPEWVWLLTVEGSWRQLALVHAVDGAVGAHGAARSEAVEHLACLDQRFASLAARKFTVGLGQRGKTSRQNNKQLNVLQ